MTTSPQPNPAFPQMVAPPAAAAALVTAEDAARFADLFRRMSESFAAEIAEGDLRGARRVAEQYVRESSSMLRSWRDSVVLRDIELSPRQFDENAEGAVVGTLTSTARRGGVPVTFALEGEDARHFRIDEFNQIVLAPGFAANFEADRRYDLWVRATDALGTVRVERFGINVRDVNEALTDIFFKRGPAEVDENRPGAFVAKLRAADQDWCESHTFEIVGGPDAAFFRVDGRMLRANPGLDFEAAPDRFIVVRVTDKGGLSFEKELHIKVRDRNDAPTDIQAAASAAMFEGDPRGTAVATLTASDQDAGDRHTFRVVGGADGRMFRVVDGNTLVSNGTLRQGTVEVEIEASDSRGGRYRETMRIEIPGPNRAPTDVLVVASNLAENMAPGEGRVRLRGIDPNPGDTVRLEIVGGRDGALFDLDAAASELVARAPFDFESRATAQVVVRATDSRGLFVDRLVEVAVRDVNEAPTDARFVTAGILRSDAGPGTLVGRAFASDPDAGDVVSWRAVGPDSGLFFVEADGDVFTAATPGFNGGVARSIEIEGVDRGGLTVRQTLEIRAAAVPATDIVAAVERELVEGDGAGTPVARLSAVGLDPTDTATFSVVGGLHAGLFEIVGDQLVLRAQVDLGTGSRNVVVRVAGTDGNAYEESLTFVVNPRPPEDAGTVTDISLSRDVLPELMPPGHAVGRLIASGTTGAVSFAVTGGEDAWLFEVDARGYLRTTQAVELRNLPDGTLDIEVTAVGRDGQPYLEPVQVFVLPVTYVAGSGLIRARAGVAEAFLVDPWSPPMLIEGFDEGDFDQIAMFLAQLEQDISPQTVRMLGSDDANVTVQTWVGDWVDIAVLRNAKSSDGLLDGDGVADPITQAQLDALAQRWMDENVIHS